MAKPQDEWITSQVAADLLGKQSGHPITTNYVRLLGAKGKIEVWEVDKRTRLYRRKDVEAYRVKKRGDGSVRRAAHAPRGHYDEAGVVA